MLYKENPSRSTRRQVVATWLRPDLPAWWASAVSIAAGLYVLVTCLAFSNSFLTSWDAALADMHLVPVDSRWHGPVSAFVFLGLWIFAIILVGCYAAYRASQVRSMAPFITFLIGGALYAASVASVKYALGRVGPRATTDALTIWDGGTIYPSGHAAAAVVMYGIVALIAPVAYRKVMTVAAVVISIGVGLGTIAIGTHWMSDVVGAWFDGVLVLLITWAITPEVHRRWLLFARRWRPVRRSAHDVAPDPARAAIPSPVLRSATESGAPRGGLIPRRDPSRVGDRGSDHHRIGAGLERRHRVRRRVVPTLGGDDGVRQGGP